MIITIDGPAGTGKTTVARAVARKLGFTYFDTGAMYRTLTCGILAQGIDLENTESLQHFLNTSPVRIENHHEEKRYFLGDEDVTTQIRSETVTSFVSKVSSYAAVREKLVAIQRALSKGIDAVFEGRDMGSVVFPNAELKIFLTADPEIRAARRHNEQSSEATLQSVLQQINQRDAQDANRNLSPMKPADDAIIVDTSRLSIDEVVDTIVGLKKGIS